MFTDEVIISPSMFGVDRRVFKKYFHRCRFGGGGSTTVENTSTYTPTEYEVQLQKAQADYADAVAPNALWLNDVAREILENSIGAVQVDFDSLNNTAQEQIGKAIKGYNQLINSNKNAVNSTNKQLSDISSQYSPAANRTNNTLSGIMGKNNSAANTANSALSGIVGNNNSAANTANGTLSTLMNGTLPTAYATNMANSIRTAINNTLGANVNSLGKRGVLNSSVTNKAIDDIAKNASDAVAQQYQANINQVANLSQNRFGNSMTANNANANLVQNQFGNSMTANNANASLAQQQLGNINTALTNQQNNIETQFNNTMGANSANANVYGNLIESATAPITTAAAAQEAAQAPALNLWNASLGLNGATTGALAAAAGKGTTTSTSTQSAGGGGGLFSGLLGGLF